MAQLKVHSEPVDPLVDQKMPLSEIEEGLDELLSEGERGVVRAVDALIAQSVHHGASDLHLEPWPDCLSLRYRLDGVLHEVAMLPKGMQEKIVARIKILANMIVYQKEFPQDGRIDAHADRLGRAMRTSSFPTIHGEKIVIRVMDSSQNLFRTEALGFHSEIVQGLRDIIFRPQGTMLLTGPSSSGKTTTIYSLLRELMAMHAGSRHIVTIEDPVEYQLGRISQTQINANLDLTFQTAFRALLRQDPDVIMVGEIRDQETAQTAIRAGLTGHLVISTIHSGSSAGVFTRLLDMGVEPYLAASSVTGVLSQRLIRNTCPRCARSYKPEPELKAQYGVDVPGIKFKRGTGCDHCLGIGFRGRIAIGELLKVNEDFSDMVLAHKSNRDLQEAAVENGMTTILDDGLDRVQRGDTTLEELSLVIPPPTARTKPVVKPKAKRKKATASRARKKS